MTKSEIIAEIRRIAVSMDGVAPGMGKFEANTGVRRSDWLGVHWRSWSDAVLEAGLVPNTLQPPIDEAVYLRRYALLAQVLGHPPVKADLQLMRRSDSTFPSDSAFARRFGSYSTLRSRAHQFCLDTPDLAHIAPLLAPSPSKHSRPSTSNETRPRSGFVYLLKHGSRSEYKIGKTINPLRREGEVRLQLPERVSPVPYIETDDPSGIEAYWHARFAAKRKEGEWFALSREDVTAFRRWKRIL
jgi:hypothetical protein